MAHNDDEYVAEGQNGKLYKRIPKSGTIPVAIKKPKWPEGFADEMDGLDAVEKLGQQEHLMQILLVTKRELQFEWINGLTLAKYIEQNPAPDFQKRKRLLAQVLYGLRTLHIHGLIHGDLCADNIMIMEDPDTGEPKAILVDYRGDFISRYKSSDNKHLREIYLSNDLALAAAVFGVGFSFVATQVLFWKPNPSECDMSPAPERKKISDPAQLELLEKIVYRPNCFEDFEDLLI